MTVRRNVLALRAVSQCWNKCGNIPTDSGTNKYVKNCQRPIWPLRIRSECLSECSPTIRVAADGPPSALAIMKNAMTPVNMKTNV